MSDRGGRMGGRPWLRAWLVAGLAAWTTLGVLLVAKADNQGLVDNISISPYHVVGYAALLVLGGYVAWAFFRALRRGDWRKAFPPQYGGLGLSFVLLVAWVLLDPIWSATMGIAPGIENGVAPTRLLIPAALVALALGPVREAIAAQRRGEGKAAGSLAWAGVVAAGVMGAAATVPALNPITAPLNDWGYLPGVDNTEIWTMNADGSGQTRVLAALGDGIDYSLPAWSPDGERIAYTAWTNDGGAPQNIRNETQTSAIWTMSVDGSDRRLVVDGAPDQAWIPAWSPDGQWLAYTLTPVDPQPVVAAQPEPAMGPAGPPSRRPGSTIWIVRPDGSEARRVSPEGLDAVNPVWSPDGLSLAFTGAVSGANSEIHVGRLAESGLADVVAVAEDPATDWGPSWGSDGEHLLFVSDRSGNDDVWRAPLGGSFEDADTGQLTDDGAGDWVPAYSPDGSRIAFVSNRSGEPEIWTMAANGDDVRNLTNHLFHFDGQWSVAWAPDGSRLAYAVASFPDGRGHGWVLEDLAVAQSLLFGVVLALVAVLIVALGTPLGAFAAALLVVVGAGAVVTDQWRFLVGAAVAGLVVDGVVRSVPRRWRSRVAAALLPVGAILAIGVTIGASSALAWSVTLLLGTAAAAGAIGWAIAEVVARLTQPDPATGGIGTT